MPWCLSFRFGYDTLHHNFDSLTAFESRIFRDIQRIPDVVGYEQISLNPGKQVIRGVMFKNVSTTGLDLQAIKMDDSTLCDGTTQMWWWNGAYYDARACWCPSYDEDGNPIDANGNVVDSEDDAAKVWGDELGWIAIEKTFKKGDCFWILANDANTSSAMVPAGALVTSDTTAEYISIELTPGKQVQVTDPMPVSSFTLKDIAMDDDTLCDGTTQMWWWNGAYYDARACWCPSYDEDGNPIDADGNVVDSEDDAAKVWGDELGWIAIDKTFSAGEGFWVLPNDANTASSIMFKNPLYTAE